MIISRFTQIIPDYPLKGNFVIYSYMYNSLCMVDGRIFRKLEKAVDICELRKTLSTDEYRTLNRLGVLKVGDEKKKCNRLLERMMNARENLNLIVYLTYRCNLNCSYCFQPNKNKSVTMSKKTAEFLIRWLVSVCEEKKIKNLSILFYGGEPLLNKGVLEYILNNASEYAKSAGIKCRFSLTTNGTLLDKELIRNLNRNGLSDIQITLDGLKKKHDLRRPFKKRQISSYDCILGNLKKIAKITSKIILRVNFDKENVEDIPDFLRLVKDEKLDKRVKVHLMPVHQPVRNWAKGSRNLIPHSRLAGYFLYFYSIAKELSLSIVPYYSAGICQFFGKFSFSITPDGCIYKCPNLLQNSFRVGDIYRGLYEERNDGVRYVPIEECLGCKYVIVCAKGCRHQAFTVHKDIKAKFCEKKALDKLMEFYIKHEVEERLSKNG